MTIVHLCSPNDGNGNPRRAYLLIGPSGPLGLWDEGYDGWQAVPAEHRHLVAAAVRINISAAELRQWFRRMRAA